MDICLVIYGGNRHTLCTSHAGGKEDKLFGADCYLLLSFSLPTLLSTQTVVSLQQASCQQTRKKVCSSLECVWVFFPVNPDEAILVTVSQSAPGLCTCVFSWVTWNSLEVSSHPCRPEKHRVKNKDPLLAYCIAGYFTSRIFYLNEVFIEPNIT